MHRIFATPLPLEALAAVVLTLALTFTLSFALSFGGQLGTPSAQTADPAPILADSNLFQHNWEDLDRPPGSWATS